MEFNKYNKKLMIVIIIILIIFTCLFYPMIDRLCANSVDVTMFNVLIVVILFSLNATALFIIILDRFDRKIRISKIEKQNVDVENVEYYRDFFDNVSPLIVSKLVNKKKNFKDDIIVLMLYLKNKKIISINDGKIKLINDKIVLLKHEKYFIENYERIFYYLKNNLEPNELYWLLKEDMKDLGYIKAYDESFLSKICEYILLLSIFIGFINIFIFPEHSVATIIYLIPGSMAFLKKVVIPIRLKKVYGGFRTEKGMKLTYKSLGLKRFIEDFSSLNNKRLEEIKIWDSYLIYVIVFNIPGILDDEANELYKLILNKYIDKQLIYGRVWIISIVLLMFFPFFLMVVFIKLDLSFMIENIMPFVMILNLVIIMIMFLIKKNK